jgi:hypothetical protein
MSRRKAGLHALIRKNVTHITWIYYMLHTQALSSRNMSEELKTVFKPLSELLTMLKRSIEMKGKVR